MNGRALLLLGAYLLLFPPLFVLGPLAGLLLASRPATLREWSWVLVTGLWIALTLLEPGGIATQMMRAWALFATGAFVLIMLSGRRSAVTGALVASVFAFGAATAWAWSLGTRWRDIQLAVAHSGWEFCRQLLQQAQGAGSAAAERMAGIAVYVDALADGVAVMAELFPALLVLTALPGLALAWNWYHRLATQPAGEPSGPFAEFRFTDHLVWLVVVALAVFLLPLPPVAQALGGNLALVAGGLYAARGAAVLWGSVESFPLVVVITILAGVLFILPVALGGCFAIGLADTWVDFRRRFSAADQEKKPWK